MKRIRRFFLFQRVLQEAMLAREFLEFRDQFRRLNCDLRREPERIVVGWLEFGEFFFPHKK